MIRKLSLFLAVILAITFCNPADAGAGRVNSNAPVRPWRLLNKQFSGNANVFTTTDPSPAGGNLTETSATGVTTGEGTVTINLGAGFTAPITLTAYIWVQDRVTPTNSYWARCGANASQYSITVDSNYTTVVFVLPHNTPFIILSSAAVTGNVYVDAQADHLNANSSTSYYQQPQG